MDIDECPPEVVELAEAEDPFGSFDYLPSVAINGKTVEYSRGAGEYYNPLRSEEEIVCSGEQAARDIVKHRNKAGISGSGAFPGRQNAGLPTSPA